MLEYGMFDERNFLADIMNYIVDGSLDLVNFELTGYGSDFNKYKLAVYQIGEYILKRHDKSLDKSIEPQDTFANNLWDAYVYMGGN
jgi:ammonia channel protein AmtB